MQTTAEPFERLFRAFQGQHGLRFRHRRRNLFEKLHRPAPRGELRLAPDFVILGRDDNRTPGEVGLRCVELLDAAYRSAAQEGRPVEVA